VIARNCSFEESCARMFVAFFKRSPNDDPRDRVAVELPAVLKIALEEAFGGL